MCENDVFFLLSIDSRCDAPASWAARQMCLDTVFTVSCIVYYINAQFTSNLIEISGCFISQSMQALQHYVYFIAGMI